MNVLHNELGDHLEVITQATSRVMGLHLTGAFNPCEGCALGKAKKGRVHIRDVEHSKILGERLIFDISSPSTFTFRGKKYWLLVIKDSTDNAWSYFLKEKS